MIDEEIDIETYTQTLLAILSNLYLISAQEQENLDVVKKLILDSHHKRMADGDEEYIERYLLCEKEAYRIFEQLKKKITESKDDCQNGK